MELKKVNQETNKNYAKKNEISKGEIKNYIPSKWLIASTTGLVSLLYTNARSSIHKIGVVIGCISMETDSASTMQKLIYSFFDFASWGIGITFIVMLIRHFIKRKKFDENTRLKSAKLLKILGIILTIFIIITFWLSVDWKLHPFPIVKAIEIQSYSC